MPEKWGWIRYGRDAEKCTTDRIMKNYAEIQNNEIACYVHDKQGGRLYKHTERELEWAVICCLYSKRNNLANSFLKLPGLSTSSTVTYRMEESILSCIHSDDTDSYTIQNKSKRDCFFNFDQKSEFQWYNDICYNHIMIFKCAILKFGLVKGISTEKTHMTFLPTILKQTKIFFKKIKYSMML